MENEKEILTEAEFAKRVGLSEISITRRRKAKKITYRRDGRRIFYIAPDDVLDYYERMKKAPPTRKQG